MEQVTSGMWQIYQTQREYNQGKIDSSESWGNTFRVRRIRWKGNLNLRTDYHFNAIFVVAGEIASEIDADKNVESIPKHRALRRKRQFDYENQDETIIDAQEKHKTEFFYHLVDTFFSPQYAELGTVKVP
ncbi:Discoidin domain-containing receptor 2, partial [Araneus ventricosus]